MGIKCPKCHFDNPDTQRFCGECGTQLPPAEEISAPLTETLETPEEDNRLLKNWVKVVWAKSTRLLILR